MGEDTIWAADKLREECGLFGIYDHRDAAELTYYGLYALQHRGQESAGIAATDGKAMVSHKDMGLVSEVFDPETVEELRGHIALGHVRYSTTGSSKLTNAQPLTLRYHQGSLALAHNGNLVNAGPVRTELEATGSIFQTTTDSEVVAHLIARAGDVGIEEAIERALDEVRGGYAFAFMTQDMLIGVRDPYGIRPLCIGRIDGSYILSSETCAFDAVGAKPLREVEPGEMVIIDSDGLRSRRMAPKGDRSAFCSFEYIYFARPDSNFRGLNVHAARKEMGRVLAREHPVEADIVTGVPDSSISAAVGFAEEANIPYEMGLVKNRYIGRTFIQPSQATRDFSVQVKLNALAKLIEGQRVVLIDDSIVRGTTSKRIVRLLREAGAREVHVRISSPPYKCPCYFGIDTSTHGDLVAAHRGVDEIRDYIEADSLQYLSVKGLTTALGFSPDTLCLACFTEDYPMPVMDDTDKHVLERI